MENDYVLSRTFGLGKTFCGLTVIPQYVAENLDPSSYRCFNGVFLDILDACLLSIRSASEKKISFANAHKFADIHYTVFDDIEQDYPSRDVKLMTQKDADDIVSFVSKHAGKGKWLIIHCSAGVSRSPAVAAAIADYYGQKGLRDIFLDSTEYSMFANRYVFNMIVSAFGKVGGEYRHA